MDCATRGKLYIISTPIGHLDDVTYRGVRILKQVDLILSEDTRETSKLLNKYKIDKPQIPYTDQKHVKVVDHILRTLLEGKDIALTSDSGTPLISDPGFKLVEKVKREGFDVVSIPGPSSPIAALSISGLPTDRFLFLGFLPKTKGKRETVLKNYKDVNASIIIFESPYRVKNLLKEVHVVYGNRAVSVVKDLTKKFEEIITGNLEDVISKDLKEKGEYTVIIAKEGYKLSE